MYLNFFPNCLTYQATTSHIDTPMYRQPQMDFESVFGLLLSEVDFDH